MRVDTAMAVPLNPVSALLQNPHVVGVEDTCDYFQVDPGYGLSTSAIEIYRSRFGANELEQEEGKSIWSLLVEQFQDLLARILLMAALVSFLLALVSGDTEEGLTAFVEPLVILLILVANAAVSVWQESNAEKSLEALKKLQPELARVLRNGSWASVPAQELVPGDIVEIRVGDKVPADLRVIKLTTVSLRAEQSQLTGETQTVPKEADAMDASYVDCEIQSKINMLFASTTIANGAARAIVVATGMQTEIGKIQLAVQAAGAEEEQTPLQQKLDEFGETLSKVIGVICVLVWVINFGNFNEPSHGGFVRGCIYYFKTAVALAVAAIPEGLTAVITTCLALGTRKMAQKNAIVRRLPSVETLGCTTVICSDKTGTLTTNEMSCIRFAVPISADDLDIYDVKGHTYSPVGRITRRAPGCKTEQFSWIGPSDRGLQYFAKCACICNEAKLEIDPKNPEKFIRHGEPTEAALKVRF